MVQFSRMRKQCGKRENVNGYMLTLGEEDNVGLESINNPVGVQ